MTFTQGRFCSVLELGQFPHIDPHPKNDQTVHCPLQSSGNLWKAPVSLSTMENSLFDTNIAISALDGFQLSGHREFTFLNPLNFKMDRIFLVKIEHFSHKIPKSIITNEEILEKLQISPDKSSVSKVQKVVLSLNSYVSKSRVIGNELITQVPVLIFRRDY